MSSAVTLCDGCLSFYPCHNVLSSHTLPLTSATETLSVWVVSLTTMLCLSKSDPVNEVLEQLTEQMLDPGEDHHDLKVTSYFKTLL